MQYDERDLAILTLTLYGEARSESRDGKIAVAWTVRNRAEADLWSDGKRDWWGEGIAGVCLQNWQYTCWKDEPVGQGNRLRAYLVDGRTDKGKLTDSALADADVAACYHVAKGVLDGSMPDPTEGATHYYADYITEPKWARGKGPTVKIGVHQFYNDVEPGYEAAPERTMKPLRKSRTIAGAATAAGGTVLGLIAEALREASGLLEPFAPYSQILQWVFLALALAGIGLVTWARIDDRLKGVH